MDGGGKGGGWWVEARWKRNGRQFWGEEREAGGAND